MQDKRTVSNDKLDAALFSQAIIKFLSGLLMVGLFLFLPAGTFAYWQAWLLIGILFIPMFIAGLIMMVTSPALLRKRLDVKEEEPEQKTVIALSSLMFLAAFVVAGLNFRFSWIVLPEWVSYAAAVVFSACLRAVCGGPARECLAFTNG